MQWKLGVLTTGPPVKSLKYFKNQDVCIYIERERERREREREKGERERRERERKCYHTLSRLYCSVNTTFQSIGK